MDTATSSKQAGLRPQVVYIVGAGHSGSTLLDMILGAHSEIFSLGEIRGLPESLAANARCACHLPVWECPVWSAVVDRLSCLIGVDFSETPLALNLRVEDGGSGVPAFLRLALMLSETIRPRGIVLNKLGPSLGGDPGAIETTCCLFDAIRHVTHCPTLVDSSKRPLRAVQLCLCRSDMPYRIIHLVRDGRAVVYSKLKRAYTVEERRTISGQTVVVRTEYPSPRPQTALQAARSWLKANLMTMMALRAVPCEYRLRLRYEDLCTDPPGQLERICRFLGVAYEEEMLGFRSVVHHNLGGNPSRFRSEPILPPNNAWRTGLNRSKKRAFGAIAGWLNNYYGYH